MAEHYGIYFTTPENTTFELPVMPSTITVDRIMDVAQNTVIKTGEVDRIGERKLNEQTIEGIIPIYPKNSHLTTATSPWANGKDYIGTIEGWQDSKSPADL